MSAFANRTPYVALPVPHVAPDGREVVIAILKATFVRGADERLRTADDPAPIRFADELLDSDAADSSVVRPGDLCVAKHGADVVVMGRALSKAPVRAVDVAVRVAGRTAALRVHGERLYHRGVGGVTIGDAAPFTEKPIVYERAYGGSSADLTVVEHRNPVGRGVARNARDLIDTPAPQIEHPAAPITSAADRPEPVGFGAIPLHWSPRRDRSGTFDAEWERTRKPLMPRDYDVRAGNVAHPSLLLDERLAGGEEVHIVGMTLASSFSVTLPRLPIVVRGLFSDGHVSVERPLVDTLLIEPEAGRLELTMRAVFLMGRGRRVLQELRMEATDA